MRILSIDIETTGVQGDRNKPNNSDLLEIGLVLYDTDLHKHMSFEELDKAVPKVRIIVHRPTGYLQGNFFAFNMHKDTLMPIHVALDNEETRALKIAELEKACKRNESVKVISPKEVIDTIMTVLYQHQWITIENYTDFKDGSIKGVKDALTVAGKNVAGFDVPYLKDYIKDFGRAVKMRTRMYDPTVFFADLEKGRLPDLDSCLQMAKEYNADFPYNEVSHTAVEDAMDIVNLIHVSIKRELYMKDRAKM